MTNYRAICACGARRVLPSALVAESWADEHAGRCAKVDRSQGDKIEIEEVDDGH